jgi:urease accessory protein
MRAGHRGWIVSAAVAAWLASSTAALAHHPTGGLMPTSFLHGFLSGIGHPVIGIDHLAFVVGIGLLAAIGGHGLRLPAMFVAATTAGLLAHVAGADAPYMEVLLALSVVLIGVRLVGEASWHPRLREAELFAAAGFFHGFAFAETVIGAEPSPVIAYVLGLAVTQLVIAAIAYRLASYAARVPLPLGTGVVRALGLTIATVGAVYVGLATALSA